MSKSKGRPLPATRQENPCVARTLDEVRDALERRGICNITQMRVQQILRRAERKIREALRSELCR